MESIPWVRCASGNVCLFCRFLYLKNDIHLVFALSAATGAKDTADDDEEGGEAGEEEDGDEEALLHKYEEI